MCVGKELGLNQYFGSPLLDLLVHSKEENPQENNMSLSVPFEFSYGISGPGHTNEKIYNPFFVAFN